MIEENVKYLSKKERFDLINSSTVSSEVILYLKEIFEDLNIEICNCHSGIMLELMKKGLLEGWCWETTETSILLLKDDDYIERGNLTFSLNEHYYHSWIVFCYDQKKYVLDPCLDIICDKDLYYLVFEVEVCGKVFASQVKDELDVRMNGPKETKTINVCLSEKSEVFIDKFMKNLYGENYRNRKKDEVVVVGDEDVNSPMYRNSTGYYVEFENDKIKKLKAHYYLA